MVQVGHLLHRVVVVHGFIFLVEVLVRHDLVVASQRLHYLLSVLIYDDGLAQITATLVRELVQSYRVFVARVSCVIELGCSYLACLSVWLSPRQ